MRVVLCGHPGLMGARGTPARLGGLGEEHDLIGFQRMRGCTRRIGLKNQHIFQAAGKDLRLGEANK